MRTTTRHLGGPLRPGLRIGLRVAGGAVRRLRQWPVESQQRSCRNAMTACTALAADRAEREDVDDFLRRLPGARIAARG